MPKTRATARAPLLAARRPRPARAAALRWECSPRDEAFKGGGEDLQIIGTVGQERAVRALRLGTQLDAPGYNIYVCGVTGTGRASTVQRLLDHIKGFCRIPPDRCYVHNFERPYEPRLLTVPRGSGQILAAAMELFIKALPAEVKEAVESDDHAKRRSQIIARFGSEGDRLLDRLERRASRAGFTLKRVREGRVTRPGLFPNVQGRSHPMADLERLVEEGKLERAAADKLIRNHDALSGDLEAAAAQSRELIGRMETALAEQEREQVRDHLRPMLAAIASRFPGDARAAVSAHLENVLAEILGTLHLFLTSDEPSRSPGEEPTPAVESPGPGASQNDQGGPLPMLLRTFRVNVIFASGRNGDCPVMVESHPSYRRLFGHFEKSLDATGYWSSDFTQIRPGSLLNADGGYLVLTLEDLFADPAVWLELKRTLISSRRAIAEEAVAGGSPAVTLQPEPIPIKVKVILIGGRERYETLLDEEPDFRKIFKVLADFDEHMVRTAKTLRQYAAVSRRICSDERLGHPEPAALAEVAEYGARLAGHQMRLSTRFSDIADLLREEDNWRQQDGSGRGILARHVRDAIREAIQRHSLPQERLLEMFRDGQLLLDIKGARVGQVNGLVIHEAGEFTFGIPSRITATVSPGTAGIINIEREAEMSGSTHTKGVLIIGGYMRAMFGAGKPIALTGSVALEQSYGTVDGDSASSTEIYALLSALSGVALRQGIAVTGSVDQMGDIQPVGGINDKIEGFFRVCRMLGLTGEQGVLVPGSNMPELMLEEDVLEAVRRRKFHVYPVGTIPEGIEILTGVAAGARGEEGRYPDRTIFGLADARLTRFNDLVRRHAGLPRA